MKEVPEWLTSSLVKVALQRDSGLNVDVKSVQIKPLCKEGDNYSSLMYQITAKTSEGDMSLVAKVLPSSEQMTENMKLGRTFEREAVMLSEVIPAMHQILQGLPGVEQSPHIKCVFAPSCPYYGMEPEPLIILENLQSGDFRLADRKSGLDLPQSLMAIRALASWHAASVQYLQSHPGIVETLGNPVALLRNSFILKGVEDTFPRAVGYCKEWKKEWEEFENIGEYIERAIKTGTDQIVSLHSHTSSKFNVICHGDLWLNNMMYKFEKQEVTDIRLIDFQMSHVASPALDILYFISSSVNKDVFKSHWLELLKEYHRVLGEAMSKMDLVPLTFDELKAEIRKNGIAGVFGTLVVLPVARTLVYPKVEDALKDPSYSNEYLFTSEVKEWIKIGLVALSEWSVFK